MKASMCNCHLLLPSTHFEIEDSTYNCLVDRGSPTRVPSDSTFVWKIKLESREAKGIKQGRIYWCFHFPRVWSTGWVLSHLAALFRQLGMVKVGEQGVPFQTQSRSTMRKGLTIHCAMYWIWWESACNFCFIWLKRKSQLQLLLAVMAWGGAWWIYVEFRSGGFREMVDKESDAQSLFSSVSCTSLRMDVFFPPRKGNWHSQRQDE